MLTPLTLNGGHRIKFERERKICVLSEDHVAGKGRGEREREIVLSEKSTSNNRARVCAHARSFLLVYSKSFPEFTLIGDAARARARVCDSRNKVGIRSQRLIRRSVQINFRQKEKEKRALNSSSAHCYIFHFATRRSVSNNGSVRKLNSVLAILQSFSTRFFFSAALFADGLCINFLCFISFDKCTFLALSFSSFISFFSFLTFHPLHRAASFYIAFA